ncbi:hypothetical protein CFP65_1866 [Kitasatospora sp. MMS16-BH015]|uniref:transglutaminase family protein n=1 Tax=Kitasatospora sp. MMS16-BH015 TaxID=2018025 RepID=UPI000CA09E28|nr:DUF3488 and transglutaminase-like domain-containing protein [Kitasatospora sp. MMS16-BH015]AUG76740.1 hypothetical protein CFP65_1866 [Kitasatospora sp. MMS16-BH015]
MTTRAKLTLYSALASALAALCLTPLLHPAGWVGQAMFLIAVSAGAGAGLRRLALPRPLTVLAQLVVVVYALLLTSVASSMAYGLLPGTRAVQAVNDLLVEAGQDIREYAIPAPAHPGLELMLAGSVALIAVAVDALAVTYRRAAVAGLPLLALYSVGTGLTGGGGAWFWFLLAAFGYLLLLFAEGQDRLSRWGRVFHGSGAQGGTLSHSGHRIGLLALVCALVLPVFVPSGGLGLVDGSGLGNGPGKGNGLGLTSLNPVVNLSSSLNLPSPVELFTYQTDSPEAAQMYMRTAALDTFDGRQWSASKQPLTDVPETLPAVPGLGDAIPRSSVGTQVTTTDKLDLQWLPMPYPATRVRVPGSWQFEPTNRELVKNQSHKLLGISYAVTSQDLQPTPDQLRHAPAPPAAVLGRYLELPPDLPAEVKATAQRMTRDKHTAYDQAVALQDWFTGPEFQYSLKLSDRSDNMGNDAILRFLSDKTGFCVHFAGTMAAMARSLGIPARVAIGFAPGKDLGDGRYLERSEDYHAWPELYFEGAGWLRFEPTPRRGSTPAYTHEQAAPAPSASSAAPSSAASDQAGARPSSSSSCAARAHQLDDCGNEKPAVIVAPHHTPWFLTWQALAVLGLVLLLAALVCGPMLWRLRLRRRRLGGGRHLPGAPQLTEAQVLAAWEELIDSAWDLGIPPDEAATPRRTVQRLAEAGHLDEGARAAAGRVALATERVLYADAPAPQAPLGADVRQATEALRQAAGRRTRARATMLPASSARLRRRWADALAARQDAARARLRGRVERATARFRRRG